jgi:hypothetical protein
MADEDEFLIECGLSHEFGKDWNTYFTSVSFYGNREPRTFYELVNKGFKKLERFVKAGKLRLHIVAVTFGDADAIIIWQAKDVEAEKAFMTAVLAEPGYISKTLQCKMSQGFGPVGPVPPR